MPRAFHFGDGVIEDGFTVGDEFVVGGGDVELVVGAFVLGDHSFGGRDEIFSVAKIIDADGGDVGDGAAFLRSSTISCWRVHRRGRRTIWGGWRGR